MYLSSQIPPQCLSSHIFSTYTPKHALFPNFLISLSETTLLRLPISLATYKRVFLFHSKSPYFPENFLSFFFLFLLETFRFDDSRILKKLHRTFFSAKLTRLFVAEYHG